MALVGQLSDKQRSKEQSSSSIGLFLVGQLSDKNDSLERNSPALSADDLERANDGCCFYV